MSTIISPEMGAKTVTTSITIRPETRRALVRIGAEMAADSRRKRVGMGEVIEELLAPIFLRRGIAIDGTADSADDDD